MATANGQEIALSLNGTTSKVDMGQVITGYSNYVTLEAWIRLGSFPASGSFATIAGQGILDASDGFGLYIAGSDNKLYFQCRTGVTVVSASFAYPTDGDWHHVAGVRDQITNTTYLYLDGTQVNSATGSLTSINPSDVDNYFGVGARRNTAGAWGFYADIDVCDVRIWSDVRTTTEINNNKNSILTGTEPNLIGLWLLDELTGITAEDSTINNVDGTVTSGSIIVINAENEWTKVADTLSSQTLYNITEFNNKIYACTSGGKLFEWNGTNAWVEVAPVLNSQLPIWDIKVFDGSLYGSTGPDSTGTAGRLYKWNGTNAWVEVASTLNSIDRVFSLKEFNSKLYGGTDTPSTIITSSARLFEFNGTDSWVQVAPSLSTLAYQCFKLEEHDSKLYGGMGAGTSVGAIYEWNGTDAWIVLKGGTTGETYLYPINFDGKLYASTRSGTGKLYQVNTTTGALTEVAPQLYSQTSNIPAEGSSDRIFTGTQSNAYLFFWNGTDAWVLKATQFETETELRNSILYSQDNKIYGISNPSGYLLVLGGSPLVQTGSATSVASSSATLNGEVLNDGGSTITERGFAYNTTGNPNIADDTKVTVSGTTGVVEYDLTELSSETTYYFVAYATNSGGTSYGSVLSFTTGTAGPVLTVTAIDLLVKGKTLDLVNKDELQYNNSEWSGMYQKELVIDSVYLQSEAQCEVTANAMLNISSDPASEIYMDSKINPAIEIGDLVTINDSSEYLNAVQIKVLRQNIVWDGSLYGNTYGRRTK